MSQSKGVVISVESIWFKVAVLAGSGVAAGVTFANIIYYARLRKDNGMTAIKRSTAATMMWINIILFVVSLVLFLWSVWALIFPKSKRDLQTASIMGYAKQALGSEATVVGPSATTQQVYAPAFVAAPTPVVTAASAPTKTKTYPQVSAM